MKYNEKLKDIFKVKNVDAVIQCIAQDIGMGAGIAVTFTQRYPKMKPELLTRDVTYPSVELYTEHPTRPDVINLITKPLSYRKPTIEDFEASIVELRQTIIQNEYKTLAMPMIGAGLDGLDWGNQVLPAINEYLGDLDIELTTYFIEANARHMQEFKGVNVENDESR